MIDQYFATLPTDQIVKELHSRISKFNEWTESSGQARKWKKSHDLYYGNHVEGGAAGETTSVGADSEFTAYGMNYYRNLVKNVLALTCAQKPVYDFLAINTDSRSLKQARLANGIIDSYMVEKRMGRHLKMAAERALVYCLGYTYTPWDVTAGRFYGVEQVKGDDGNVYDKIKHEGDADIVSLSPWHVIYDPNLRDWAKNKWLIVRTYVNKFDVAARYPSQRSQILAVSGANDSQGLKYQDFHELEFRDDKTSELIPVYEFYHLPTDAIPQGRYIKFVGSEILYDGGYQYAKKKLPVQRITPGEKFDSSEGYSEFVDVMVLQTVLNILVSSTFSNQEKFGTQFVWLPEGCNVSADQIKGLVVLKGGLPGTKPEGVNLTVTPAEVFKNTDMIKNAMVELSGLNKASIGAIDSKEMSGVAIARLQAMAIQYSSNFQQSWAELNEDAATFCLSLIQQFAQTERVVALAGKSNKSSMRAFTGKDIDLIDRVTCNLGNPLSRTYAGRMEFADKMLERGEINAKQYMQVVQTGNIDTILEGEEARIELPRKENEVLMDGGVVEAMVGEPHILHAKEHGAILADPELKSRAEQGDEEARKIIENTLKHILEHKTLHETQDAFWFVVSGEAPPPPQQEIIPPPPPPEGAVDIQAEIPPVDSNIPLPPPPEQLGVI